LLSDGYDVGRKCKRFWSKGIVLLWQGLVINPKPEQYSLTVTMNQ